MTACAFSSPGIVCAIPKLAVMLNPSPAPSAASRPAREELFCNFTALHDVVFAANGR
jgi:hypothetical protein